jgi:quercetin dioxygenase-like cupin family protein
MYIYNPERRERKVLAPGITARTFWGEKMLLSVAEIAPHTQGRLHSHPHEQVGTVLEGTVSFTVDGHSFTATAGTVFVIPGDVEHSASTSENRAVLLEVFSPVREEFK